LRTPAERRLRGAVTFSVVCMLALLGSSFLMNRMNDVEGGILFEMSLSLAVVVAAVFSFWYLLSVLLERRPVMSDPHAKWVWVWTAAIWITLVTLAVANREPQSFASATQLSAGWFVGVSGLLVLPWSLLPRRRGSTR
jgi:hypothetical protein